MSSPLKDPNIRLIYAATLFLGIGYGIAISLFSLYLTAQHFTKSDIGYLAAIFAAGLTITAIPVGQLIHKVSARGVLTAALIGYAGTVAALPYLKTFAGIGAARFIDGACSAGIWVGCETLLLTHADKEHKANVMSLYAICMSIGYVVGPLCAQRIATALSMQSAFLIAGVLATIAGLMVFFGLTPGVNAGAHEEPPEAGPYRTGTPVSEEKPAVSDTPAQSLVWSIKTSCLATFSYGYFQSSVVLFLPLYLVETRGISPTQTIIIPAFFAAGMLLFTNVAGRLGDRFGHLRTMRVLAVLGALTIGGFFLLHSFAAMAAATFVAGATLASISPVSLALQGHVVNAREYARANGIYNAFYASGMLLGPPISSQVFRAFGGVPMLTHLAVLWGFFAIVSVVFRRDDPAERKRLGGGGGASGSGEAKLGVA